MDESSYRLLDLVGSWLTAIGTIGAVVVALALARGQRKVRLRVSVGSRVLVAQGDPRPAEELDRYVSVRVTNVGRRPVLVTSLEWSFGIWPNKVYLHQIPGPLPVSAQVPLELGEGQESAFLIPFEGEAMWLNSMATELKEYPLSWLALRTLRMNVVTSYGTKRSVVVEPGLRKKLRDEIQLLG